MQLYPSWPMYYGASKHLVELARQLRSKPTPAESKMWQLLTSAPFNKHRFRRQHPLAKYIADFYCHSLGLVIEVDGDIHLQDEQVQYDKFRNEDMQLLGIKVLRFTNEQVLNETQHVKQEILKCLSKPSDFLTA